MVFHLTENEKILIIFVATLLFLISVLITICIVSPACILNQYIFKVKSIEKLHKPSLLKSRGFQLNILPYYGSNNLESLNHITSSHSSNSQIDHQENTFNCDNLNFKQLEEVHKNNSNENISLPLLWAVIDYIYIGEKTIQINFFIEKVENLSLNSIGIEPNCYLIIDIGKNRFIDLRRSSLHKIINTFQTQVAKASLNPIFLKHFSSILISKKILKNGNIRIKLMEHSKYTNDTCLSQVLIPIKDIRVGQNDEVVSPISYQMKLSEETKGEISIVVCYLPTAKRVTISQVTGRLDFTESIQSNYYVRFLMFINSLLIKKKKTNTDVKLSWLTQNNLTFDIGDSSLDKIVFLVVLFSSNLEIINSSSAPSSPKTPESYLGPKKEEPIGHGIISKTLWNKVKHQARQPVYLSLKLI